MKNLAQTDPIVVSAIYKLHPKCENCAHFNEHSYDAPYGDFGSRAVVTYSCNLMTIEVNDIKNEPAIEPWFYCAWWTPEREKSNA